MPRLGYLWAQFRHTWAKRGKSSAFRINSAVDVLHKVGRLGTGSKVLSLGCRNRVEPDLLEAAGWNVTAVDLFPMQRGIRFADMHRLPFKDGTFHAVVASHVLEHSHNPQMAMSEIARVLKPGGLLWAAWPTNFETNAHDRNDYGEAAKFAPRFVSESMRMAVLLWSEDKPNESRALLGVQ